MHADLTRMNITNTSVDNVPWRTKSINNMHLQFERFNDQVGGVGGAGVIAAATLAHLAWYFKTLNAVVNFMYFMFMCITG